MNLASRVFGGSRARAGEGVRPPLDHRADPQETVDRRVRSQPPDDLQNRQLVVADHDELPDNLGIEGVLDQIIESLSDSLSDDRQWQQINLDLPKYKDQQVTLRLYQRVLIPHHEAGNAYWKNLTVN